MIHKIIGGRGKQRNIKTHQNFKRKKENEQEFIRVLSGTDKQDLLNFNKTIISKKPKKPIYCRCFII
jgi:hypothetical protein